MRRGAQDYRELKAKGIVKLVKTKAGIILQRSKWDADTGQPTTPELAPVNEVALVAEREQLQAEIAEQIADIDELITDAKAKKAKKERKMIK